ncbi:MAG TPA: hypothetical protein VG936_06405 [Lacunisphaera sp.]|nr:hypothetical protein [Lacunisphaera sp.]
MLAPPKAKRLTNCAGGDPENPACLHHHHATVPDYFDNETDD